MPTSAAEAGAVEDAAAREQLRVEELVAHDRVGDRARPSVSAADRERRARPGRRASKLNSVGISDAEAVEREAGAETDADRAAAAAGGGARGCARWLPTSSSDRGEPEAQVDEREQRLMDREEERGEQARPGSGSGATTLSEPGRDTSNTGVAQGEHEQQDEVEGVRQEHQHREARSPGHAYQGRPRCRRAKGRSSGKMLREQEQRREEELPQVREALGRIGRVQSRRRRPRGPEAGTWRRAATPKPPKNSMSDDELVQPLARDSRGG